MTSILTVYIFFKNLNRDRNVTLHFSDLCGSFGIQIDPFVNSKLYRRYNRNQQNVIINHLQQNTVYQAALLASKTLERVLVTAYLEM